MTNAPDSGRRQRTARRVQLLEAAKAVFVRHGYHAASMDEIAERAGVSKPILYKHFDSKLDLYLALLDDATDALLEQVGAALTGEADNAAKVRAAIAVYYAFVDAGSPDYRLIFESDATGDPAVRERLDEVNARIAREIATAIRRATGLPGPRPEILGAALAGMAEVSARTWLAGGRAVAVEETVDLVADLAWRGIAHVPPVDDPVEV